MERVEPKSDTGYESFLKKAGPLFDLDWRKFRRRSARRHVEERMWQLGCAGYQDYLERLCADAGEARRLPDRMRVTVSRFWRERECWQELAGVVLPALIAARQRGAPLRAWSVGCCNGEEPYSLALVFRGIIGSTAVDILATDIDEVVLGRAREGCYGKSSLREVPAGILARFFYPRGQLSCVDQETKDLVSFKRHNFVDDVPPADMDLILCRYLAFTYYQGPRRLEAARRIWEALKPGGALMIGRKDRLGLKEKELFERWPGTGVVYTKKPLMGQS